MVSTTVRRPCTERGGGRRLAHAARAAAHDDPDGRIGEQTVDVQPVRGQFSHYPRVIRA
jgi:hypothetical protein